LLLISYKYIFKKIKYKNNYEMVICNRHCPDARCMQRTTGIASRRSKFDEDSRAGTGKTDA
jgi:hypothetical protein